MTPTILTNLALSKIGHTTVKALGDTSSKEARLAALHYEPCLREALRAHFWSFAMTTRPLAGVDVREYLSITGPLRVHGDSTVFPRLYLQADEVDGKAHYAEIPEADSGNTASRARWDANDGVWMLEHGPRSARWTRRVDVETPDLIPLRPSVPKHFLETNLEGNHNDLRFEQVDQTAPAAAVQYAATAETPVTRASFADNTLTVTPGNRARMIVSGIPSPSVSIPLMYAGYRSGHHHWTSNGIPYDSHEGGFLTVLYHEEGFWICRQINQSGSTVYRCEAADESTFPDGVAFSAPTVGFGTCVVTKADSNALQVMEAMRVPITPVILVSGTASDGESILTFPPLHFVGMQEGCPAWTDHGTFENRGNCLLVKALGDWHLSYSHMVWTSTDDVLSPELATTWTPVYPAEGVPIVKAVPEITRPMTVLTAALKTGNDGSGGIVPMAKATLSGGVTGAPVIKRVTPRTELLGWTHAFELPGDFVKARALFTPEGRRIDKFAIRRVAGRTCILCNHESVSLEYVQFLDDVAAFDPLFVKAFTTLLAAKLARAISGSDDMEARFLQIFETVDLPAARTASGHETDSSENHPLRELLDGTLTPGRGDFFGGR